MSAQQLDFLNPTPAQRFAAWKETPSGRHVLNEFYRQAAGYCNRWVKTGQRVSARLIAELVRDKIKCVRARAKQRGIKLQKWGGYAINDWNTPSIARHIMDRRPEWRGCFETRELGVVRRKRRVSVIDEDKAA